MTFNHHTHCFCHLWWCRCGSWAPRAPTSLWRATTRAWTVSASTAAETSPTSYLGATTTWPRSGTIRYKRVTVTTTRCYANTVSMCLLVCQNKTCIQTLEGHTNNINCISFYPQLPIILTGSEDGGCRSNTHDDTLAQDTGSECWFPPGTIRVWHSNTYRLENTLDYNLDRAWCLCTKPCSNIVALGFDNGAVVIQVGLPAVPHSAFTWKHAKRNQMSLPASSVFASAGEGGTSHVHGLQREDHLGSRLRGAAGQLEDDGRGRGQRRREASARCQGHGQLRDPPTDPAAQPQREVRVCRYLRVNQRRRWTWTHRSFC